MRLAFAIEGLEEGFAADKYLEDAVFDLDVEESVIGRRRHFDVASAVASTAIGDLGPVADAQRTVDNARRCLGCAILKGGERVAERRGHRLGGERERVARLLHRVQDVQEPRMTAALQLAHAVTQHLRYRLLPTRLVQLVRRALVEHEN